MPEFNYYNPVCNYIFYCMVADWQDQPLWIPQLVVEHNNDSNVNCQKKGSVPTACCFLS